MSVFRHFFFAVMRCLLFFPLCCGVDSPPMSPSLLYLKPLRNSSTFLHVIYKWKKKTNLLCILNNVFQYSKIRTRKRNAKKGIKTEKIWNPALFGIRNPLSWNPDSKKGWIPIFFCFNAFLRISFSCSNLAILIDVV